MEVIMQSNTCISKLWTIVIFFYRVTIVGSQYARHGYATDAKVCGDSLWMLSFINRADLMKS